MVSPPLKKSSSTPKAEESTGPPPIVESLWTRRRVLRTLFCSSAALGLNLRSTAFAASDAIAPTTGLSYLAIGDFGSQSAAQFAVAEGLKTYASKLPLPANGLLLLGDNFYKKMEGGLNSPRWQTGFEQMYPVGSFPNPCPAVLGNHDYRDNVGGEKVQLAYARQPGTRWTMPAKWYRQDTPLVTFLFLDTNVPSVTSAALTAEEAKEQWQWLETELQKPRAPWTIVAGHHPVYSNGKHGDIPTLVKQLGPLLQRHGVALYLCGHDHDLQHLELEGLKTSFVISGGGGARVREGTVSDEVRGPYSQPVYGFTHLEMAPEQMVVRHFDANGKALHAFRKLPDFSFAVI